MSKPKDPCAVCPFIRDCIAEGEDRRWCLVWLLTLEVWARAEQRRKQKEHEAKPIEPDPNVARRSVGLFGPGGLDLCEGCNRKPEYDRSGYCLDCARIKL